MASTSSSEPTHPVVFTTQTPYPLPSQKFMIPTTWKRYQLSQLVNKALSLPKPIPFEFLVRGEILRGTLAEWCAEKGIGEVRRLAQQTMVALLTLCVPCRKRLLRLSTLSRSCRLSACHLCLTKTGYLPYHVKYLGMYTFLKSHRALVHLLL